MALVRNKDLKFVGKKHIKEKFDLFSSIKRGSHGIVRKKVPTFNSKMKLVSIPKDASARRRTR